jgi:MYXO-CTERM domain-containing protein
LAAGSAQAAPVSYIAGTVAQTDGDLIIDFHQQQSSSSTSTYTPGPQTYERVDTAADLRTGQVHARAENIATNSPDGQSAYGTAYLADSFRHLSGLDPFAWNSSTTARFDIHIDGHESLVSGSGEVFNFAMVALIIYRPGTLDDFVPYCGSNVVTAFFWSVGDRAPATNPCGGAFAGHLSGAIDENLSAVFTPGGDFDWAFGMSVGGAFNANLNGATGSGQWLQDFGNTATLRYVAPDGAEVQSASGVFPGTGPLVQAVPEPASLALAAVALLGLGATRRRQRSG